MVVVGAGSEQFLHDRHGARGIVDVHQWPLVDRLNFDGRVCTRGGGSSDEQGNGEALALHFAGQKDHFVERWRDESAQANGVDAVLDRGI